MRLYIYSNAALFIDRYCCVTKALQFLIDQLWPATSPAAVPIYSWLNMKLDQKIYQAPILKDVDYSLLLRRSKMMSYTLAIQLH